MPSYQLSGLLKRLWQCSTGEKRPGGDCQRKDDRDSSFGLCFLLYILKILKPPRLNIINKTRFFDRGDTWNHWSFIEATTLFITIQSLKDTEAALKDAVGL